MGSVIRRSALVAATALLALAPGARAADATYGPSAYEAGPAGGDQFNRSSVGDDGRITVGRAYPLPGTVVGCNAKSGYAKYVVTHSAGSTVDSITVAFTEAAADPYVFLVASVKDANGRYLDHASQRGALVEGTLVLDELDYSVDPPVASPLTIEFGIETSSACPAFGFGTARFTGVTVDEA